MVFVILMFGVAAREVSELGRRGRSLYRIAVTK